VSEVKSDTFLRLAKVLKALAHPLRLGIMCGLRQQNCTQTYIAEKLGLPQSTIAQHLKVLRSEGVIKAERRGVEVVFSIADETIHGVLVALCTAYDHQRHGCYSWDEIAAAERERRMNGC
jgi:DNA-binding transcriptional ArsR family regulator